MSSCGGSLKEPRRSHPEDLSLIGRSKAMGPDVILQDGPQSETGRRILFRPGVFRRSRRDPQFRARGSHQGALLEPVTNGVLAASVMVMLMLLVRNR